MKSPTVLIADDERSIRKLVGAILAQDGYEVMEANDGFEALQIAANTPPDLLVTDILMPGMSGPELIFRLKERGTVDRFLLLSGYSGDALDTVHGLHERVPFLQKPFTPERLLAKIREALGCCVTEGSSKAGRPARAA